MAECFNASVLKTEGGVKSIPRGLKSHSPRHMIIVGLENCDSCKKLKRKHPQLQYIEIPRRKGITDEQIYKIKKLLGKNKLNQFPLIMKDDFSDFISMKEFDPEFAKEYPKLY